MYLSVTYISSSRGESMTKFCSHGVHSLVGTQNGKQVAETAEGYTQDIYKVQ